MAAGTPLDDGDRWLWLARVGGELATAGAAGLVIACSALKRSYRDAIRAQTADTLFLHLDGTREVLASRLEGRSGHFMPAALLDSQLATVEPLADDEPGTVVDVSGPVDAVVATAVAGLAPARNAPARRAPGRPSTALTCGPRRSTWTTKPWTGCTAP